MPETLSRIISAVGAKVNYEKSWYVSGTDVINDVEAQARPKLVILPFENGTYVPVSVDTDWQSYTFSFDGIYQSEKVARQNASVMVNVQRLGGVCR